MAVDFSRRDSVMRNLVCCALLVGFLGTTTSVQAVEIKNLRLTTGPNGSVRPGKTFLPGDLLFLSFDVSDLSVDAKNGKIAYQTLMEITNSKNEKVFNQKTATREVRLMQGGTLPTYVFTLFGDEQPADKYSLKLTVTDQLTKKSSSSVYQFEIKPKSFGLVQPVAPGVAFLGQDIGVSFALIGMERDDKGMPDVDITLQVEDKFGGKAYPKEIKFNTSDVHNPPATDLTKTVIVPMQIPLFLNKKGSLTIKIRAMDKLSNRVASLELPLIVLDAAEFTGK